MICAACVSDKPITAFEWRSDVRLYRRTCRECRNASRAQRNGGRQGDKLCSDCGEIKPTTEFYSNQARPRSSCKRCDLRTKASVSPSERNRKQTYNRAYYKRNSESLIAAVKAYARRRPDVKRISKQRRLARLADTEATLTTAEWLQILEYHDHRCAYCLRSGLKLTMDHVVALKRNGGTTPENIVPACVSCNSRKHTSPVFMMAAA